MTKTPRRRRTGSLASPKPGVNADATADDIVPNPAAPKAEPETGPERGPEAAPRGGAFPIVGIGASAGGLEAFTALLKHLPLETGMGFVLVQHLDPDHESALTQLLGRATTLPVHDVTNGLRVEPNHVYVIPRNTNLGIVRGVLTLHPRPHTRAPHRSIDTFFEALAADQHEQAIGVILSGTASDGTLGLEAIKAEGGITFAQDESARYDSMPRSAVAAGCVDFVLSPEQIAQELGRIATHPAITATRTSLIPADDRASATAHDDTSARHPTVHPSHDAKGGAPGDSFRKILLLLRNHSGVDFSLYKSSTIERRVTRRTVLTRHDTRERYAQFLRGNSQELDALYSDVLIGVTSFFRNPEAFDVLRRTVWPALLRQPGDGPLRVWTLGCSTGQEAYSIAMAFVEAADKAPRARTLQVFATDLNDRLLEKARHGLYAKSVAQDLSPERLRRFFVEEEGGYRISKALREMVVFARQNVIGDPPFSRMDIISCRNLLIYFESELQRRVFPLFHYALKPGGFLFLGASESVGGFTELFETVDKKHRVYVKKAAPTPAFQLPAGKERGEPGTAEPRQPGRPLRMPVEQEGATDEFRAELSAQREADRLSVNRFAPPAVLINADLQILQFRGATGAYLQAPSGKATFDVLKMARNGLMLPLRAAITKAKKDNKAVRKEHVRVEQDGEARTVHVEVIPLRNLRERCFLIVFEDAEKAGHVASVPALTRGERDTAGAPSRPGGHSPRGEALRRVAELESDLAETRDYLQSLQEQHEAANEELQASNEEVQSANEELQSINEELETSKEELESSNEELTTVNEEMSNRNTELNLLNSDLVNVQTAAHVAIVLLARNLTIRRFSAQAETQFNLLAADVGRPIGNVRHNLDLPDLEPLITGVIDTVIPLEREVQDKEGHWYSLRVRPYLTLDNKVDGAVLVLVDINDLKRSEQVITAARNYAENIVATVREPLLVLNSYFRVESANRAFYDLFGGTPATTVGRLVYDLSHRQWDTPELRVLLEKILSEDRAISDVRVEQDFEGLGHRTTLLNGRRMHDPEHRTELILLACEDITGREEADQGRARLSAIVESSDDAIISKDLNGVMKTWNISAERIFGYTAQEAVGQPVTILFPEDRLDEEPRILDRILRGEPTTHFETIRRRKDGGLFNASITVSPIRDRRGTVVGASKIVRDVTDRTRVEAALRAGEERYRTLFNSMDEGYCVIEMLFDGHERERAVDYRFLEVNHVFESQSGMHDVVGKRMREFVSEIEGPWLANYGRVALTGEAIRFESEYKGLGRWFDVFAFRVDLPRAGSVAVLFTDITARKEADVALREADRHKTEFLAMLAHELRNPLAPILGSIEILRRAQPATPADLSRPADRALDVLQRQVAQMVRLVDDLLDAGRISRGKIDLRLETVELASLVHHAVDAARGHVGRRDQELTVVVPTVPMYVHADSARLAQIIGNLLNNASKFTHRGGHIWLTLEQADESNETDGASPSLAPQAVIRVRDSGIGIAADRLEGIFEMFTQLDVALERSLAGLGIGLTLVRTLAEMHGGTVEASSPGIDRGAEFIVRLPAVVPAPRETPQPAHPSAVIGRAAVPLRILIVDDNRDSADMLAMLLGFGGHNTHTAHDGVAAVAEALRLDPDVVLLDIGLPGLSGYEVARRIREQHSHSPSRNGRPALVALTGWGQDEDRRRSEEAGFDAHLVKPVDEVVLERLLAELGAGSKAADDQGDGR